MARSLRVAGWVGIATLLASAAAALVPVGTSFSLASGGDRDAAWSNGLLYSVTAAGFQIVDVGHPATGYAVVARQPGSFGAIAVDGARAYLVGAAGLSIFDVSDPAAPALLGTLPLAGSPLGVALTGSRAIVAVDPLGLRVVDVADPAAPVLLGSLDLETTPLPPQLLPFGSAARVAALGGFAYLVSHRGVDVLDARDPAATRWIATLDVVPGIRGAEAALQAGFLYVAGRDASDDERIHVFDVGDPSAPRHVGTAGTRAYSRFALDGDTLYADNGLDFQAFDVSDPAAVAPRGVIVSPSNFSLTLQDTAELVVGGGFAYAVVAPLFGPPSSTLRGVSLDVVASPRRTLRVPTAEGEGGYEAIAVAGDRLIGVCADRLEVNSIASPLDPVLLGSVVLPGSPYDVALAGGVAYVASETNLAIVDVSDPRAPALLRTLALEATAVARTGDRLYVGTEDGDLEIYDVAHPARPVWLGSLEVSLPPPPVAGDLNPLEVYDLELAGDVLYVATLIGVRSVDVRDPAAPVSLGTFSIPSSSYLRNMALSGSLLFVGGIGGARIIDASDPAQMREIKKFTNVGLYDLQVAGDRLILSGVVLTVYDISRPSEPRVVGGVQGGGGALAIAGGVTYAGSVSVDDPFEAVEFGPEYGLTVPAAIDIAPGDPYNELDRAATRFVTVALLGSDGLHAGDVAAASLAFGPHRARATRVTHGDANHDGRADLLAVFRVADTGLAWRDARACLTGEMADGRSFESCDAIEVMDSCWSERHGDGSRACTPGGACWRGVSPARTAAARGRHTAYCIRN